MRVDGMRAPDVILRGPFALLVGASAFAPRRWPGLTYQPPIGTDVPTWIPPQPTGIVVPTLM